MEATEILCPFNRSRSWRKEVFLFNPKFIHKMNAILYIKFKQVSCKQLNLINHIKTRPIFVNCG